MPQEIIQSTPVISANEEGESFNFLDFVYVCLKKWYWIVISVAVCLFVALAYIITTPPSYQRSATILVKEDSKGKPSGGVAELMELSNLSMVSNVENEIATLQSPTLVLDVVKRLGLDVDYYKSAFFYDHLLYGRSLPFSISFLDIDDEPLEGDLSVTDEDEFTLSIEKLKGKSCEYVVSGNLSDTVMTDVGRIVVSRNRTYIPPADDMSALAKKLTNPDQKAEPVREVKIHKKALMNAVDSHVKNIEVTLQNKNAEVIDIVYNSVSPQLAEDFINTLIIAYNENWVDESNQVAISTSKFIDDRLVVILRELGTVDDSISTYKSHSGVYNIDEAAAEFFKTSNETTNLLLDYNNRRAVADYVRKQLSGNLSQSQLLPANSGIDNASIESQIAEYNSELLQRNRLAEKSSDKNPLVVESDKKLAQIRTAILASLDNYIYNIDSQIKTLRQQEARSNANIYTSPTQATQLLSVERQQKVKEALYIYLLQKREENEIGKAFTPYNTRIINNAIGSDSPVAPAKGKILLIAFAVGLVLPIGVLYCMEQMNTTVRGRKDIENMTTPFVGEIPLYQKGKENNERPIVVKSNSRSVVNEAFRVIRTNLEFMLSNSNHKVLMLSSFNPGSGKTFIAMNLAISYTFTRKRVVVVDLDLRKASLSTYVGNPKEGVSEYLNGTINDFHDIMLKNAPNEGVDFIPCGKFPPNPSELLYSPRLEQMINTLAEEYDYVFLDCPPAEMLADASLINKYVDLTLFVIRAGLFVREMLPNVDEMYQEKKYKNMATILNGTALSNKGKYGYNKYGYGRGYGYGYGYGS